ncbi:MAG: hypothetical protein AAB265_03215, partial [candidate division NC10 bacterium]
LNVEDSGWRLGLFAPAGLSPSRLNVEDSGWRLGLFAPAGLIGASASPILCLTERTIMPVRP